jgi:APA family basic amino acid/polyamine antiporter
MAAGLMRLRRTSGYSPAYHVWAYPAIPIVFIAASAYIVVTQIVAEPVASLTGLLFVAAGLPVYWFAVRKPSLPTPTPPPPPTPQHAD